ncbi:MAG: MazG nucleotide pyrophosphohydrolase domain-containing protein [Lachnospirales bacterium]
MLHEKNNWKAISEKNNTNLADVEEVVEELFSDHGCQWDKSQTFETLKSDFLEELYELIEAVDTKDINNITEEIGDCLLSVLLYVNVGVYNGLFNKEEVYNKIAKKMINRHPHVFQKESTSTITNVDHILAQWEEIKRNEKEYTVEDEIKRIPNSYPALLKADKINKKRKLQLEDYRESLLEIEEDFAKAYMYLSQMASSKGFSSEVLLQKFLNNIR